MKSAMRILLILLKKEWLQFRRNQFLPKMVIMFPLMVMLVMPLVTTMDVKDVKVAVVDRDRLQLSRRIVGDIEHSSTFALSEYARDYDEALAAVEHGDADAVLTIPAHCERDLSNAEPVSFGVDANGVNAVKGQLGAQCLVQSMSMTVKAYMAEKGVSVPSDDIEVAYNYNNTLNYYMFMIPALMVILVIMICGFLPALNMVGEKEVGTIEQINVSPVGRITFTLSKLVLYWGIGLVVLTLAMTVAYLAYGVKPEGSFLLIYLSTLIFSFVMSGLGVAIANTSSTMQQSMYVMFFFIVIFQLMSGLMTPVYSMPEWAQDIAAFVPPRYFIDIMRAVYLKGATIADIAWPLTALAIFAVFNGLVAMLTYRKQS